MNHTSAFTRREFLNTSLVAVSTVATVPAFLQRSAQVMAAEQGQRPAQNAPGTPDERILVVVQLSGGNDGLNTVVPYGFKEYYAARPTLAVAQSEVLKFEKVQGVGLHPQMQPLHAMMNEGSAVVVQGVGYPNPNRSHFASMDVWHTGDTLGGRGLGWVGRTLDEMSVARGALDATCCVSIGAEAPLATQGKRVKPVSFQNAKLFRWVAGDLHESLAKEYQRINQAGASSGAAASELDFVARTAMDAQVASARIRQAVAKPPQSSFPGSELGNQLRMVASMIRAELPTRVYYVGMGGFDTHAAQPARHGNLLRDFTAALRAFYVELKSLGVENRVLTLAFSEFGRRVQQNASNGTDHGAAGPMFLFGPMVRAGVVGEHPSLAADKLDDGDVTYSIDFRSVYATAIEHWLKIDSAKALGKRFATLPLLA